MKKVKVINGPNLNRTGLREKQHYGNNTLEDINQKIKALADSLDITCDFFQSNSEGAIIDEIHKAHDEAYTAVIINAGGYTHTSVAIRDAITSGNVPFVEVHMSNIFARENFRHTSMLSEVCKGSIVGFGAASYLLAVQAIALW